MKPDVTYVPSVGKVIVRPKRASASCIGQILTKPLKPQVEEWKNAVHLPRIQFHLHKWCISCLKGDDHGHYSATWHWRWESPCFSFLLTPQGLRLKEARELQEFLRAGEDELVWMREAEALLSNEDLGKDLQGVRFLLKKHQVRGPRKWECLWDLWRLCVHGDKWQNTEQQ